MHKPRYSPGHPTSLRMLAGLLVLLSGTMPMISHAQGLLPILDTESTTTATMTPITEMTGAPLTEQPKAEPTTAFTPAEDVLSPLPGYNEPPAEAPQAEPTPQAISEPAPQLKSAEPTLELKAAMPEPKAAAPTEKAETKASSKKNAKKAKTIPATTAKEAAVEPLQPVAAVEKKAAEPTTKPETATSEPAAPRKPLKLSVDFSQAIQDAKKLFQPDAKAIQPISYSPLPGIAVFAVMKHGNDRAFGDLPLVFAREYAQRLGAKVPNTKIYHPIYTVDELRMQGLGHIYDQIMAYYVKTGAPEPTAMDYLLKQLSTNRPNISRIIFVEADVDFSHPDASTNLMDRVKLAMTDDTPKQMKYFVNSRLQIFDAEKPSFPIVWAGSWRRSVKTDQFYNVTPSVYTDTDSQQAFARVSRQMSQEIIYVTPKDVYMTPQFGTDVEGKLVTNKQPAFPNLPESQTAGKNLSTENKQAIERILQRQNDISP